MKLEEMEGKIRELIVLRDNGTIDNDTFRDTVESIVEGEVLDKLEAYACVIEEMSISRKLIDEKIAKLQARKKSLEKDEEWLRGNILSIMQTIDAKSLRNPFHTFTRTFSKSRQVVVDCDVNNLPDWAVRTKKEVNREAISDWLKQNESCEFAHFAEAKETLTIR